MAIMLNTRLSFQTLVAILALTAPAPADPPGALPQQVRTFDDWRLDCRADPCAVATSVHGADGSEVLRAAVTEQALVLATTLPLLLPDGLELAIGAGTEPRVVPWRTCGAGGCEAVVPLDPALLAALRRERAAAATFTLVDGVRVRLPFSLLGFSAATRARAAD
jgi:invasion protein IalB